jgi:hypothetical protein
MVKRFEKQNSQGETNRGARAMEWLRVNALVLSVYVSASLLLSVIMYPTFNSIAANVLSGVATAVVAPYVGYLTHLVSHRIEFGRYVRKITWVATPFDTLLHWVTVYLDFHRKVHHDDTIGKRWMWKIVEAMHNVQCVALNLIVINVFVLRRILNNDVIVLWGLLYATMHAINFSMYRYYTHENHHANTMTNYEPYVFDILHGTAYECDDERQLMRVDNLNNGAINVVFLTALIIFVKNKHTYY